MGPKKIEAIVKMFVPTIPHDIQVFNDLTQFYCSFCEIFALIITPITKPMQISKAFIWTYECQDAWKTIKWKYAKGIILIALHWDKEFHVHMDASNLAIKTQCWLKKLMVSAISTLHMHLCLLSTMEWNYTTTNGRHWPWYMCSIDFNITF